MSSRKAYVRENFAAVMRKQESQAIHSTPATPRRVEPFSKSVSGPSHPAFDRLEEMRIKQLQEVTWPALHLMKGLRYELTALQDCETLKKGFTKLRDKYTQSVAMVSAVEDELNTCRGESEQLRTQVATLQEELRVQSETLVEQVATLQEGLRVQSETLVEQVASATSVATAALRRVRIDTRYSRPAY